MIPIADYRQDGGFEGDDYIFSFRVYHNKKDINASDVVQLEDKKGLWASYYTAVIKNAKKESCSAVAGGKFDDLRNLAGCFALTTEIRMADGKDKMIAFIKPGDMVWNPMTRKNVRVSKVVQGPEADKPMYEIGYNGNVVVVTEDHPFHTRDGLKAAKDLKSGLEISSSNGQFAKIDHFKIRPIDKSQKVRNIVLESGLADADHMVLADGIVTGDLHLQQKLMKQKNEMKIHFMATK